MTKPIAGGTIPWGGYDEEHDWRHSLGRGLDKKEESQLGTSKQASEVAFISLLSLEYGVKLLTV